MADADLRPPPTHARLLRMLALLQSRPDWSGPELAQRLDVTTRTIRNDVARLRELGYPVDAVPGVAGGYRLSAGTEMPPLLLDDEEVVAVAVGLRTAASTSIEGIEETALRAFAKLDQLLPSRLRKRVGALQSHVEPLYWRPPDATVDPESLAVFSMACRDREQVRFDYADKGGTQTRRLVEPFRLVPAGHRWYLVAWDVRRDDWRTFRLDRTSRPRLAGVRTTERELPARRRADLRPPVDRPGRGPAAGRRALPRTARAGHPGHPPRRRRVRRARRPHHPLPHHHPRSRLARPASWPQLVIDKSHQLPGCCRKRLPVSTKAVTAFQASETTVSQRKRRTTSHTPMMQPNLKARPIQRFAQAVSKCSAEVRRGRSWLPSH